MHHEAIETEQVRAIEFRAERRNRLPAQRGRRGRDINEIAVVRNNRVDSRLVDPAAEQRDFLWRELARPPLTRRLREDLQRFAARCFRAIDRSGQTAGDRHMCPEARHQSPNTSASPADKSMYFLGGLET